MKNFVYTFYCLLLLFFTSCQKQDDLYSLNNPNGPQLKDIISITALSAAQADADSLSVIDITIQIAPEADTNLNTVTFNCSGGVFSNGDTIELVKPDASGIAHASLIDNKEEKVRITAKVLNYAVDTTVNFIAALPDDLLVTADNYTGDTTTSFNITTSLFRNSNRGLVTDPVKMLFKVVALDTSITLVYPDFAFTQNRQTTITISNPYHVMGRFNIEAKTLSAQGDTLFKTARLIVN